MSLYKLNENFSFLNFSQHLIYLFKVNFFNLSLFKVIDSIKFGEKVFVSDSIFSLYIKFYFFIAKYEPFKYIFLLSILIDLIAYYEP